MGTVASVFGGVSGGGGESGKIYTAIDNAFAANGLGGNQGNEVPAAYLNYILVDKDYKFLTMGWQAVTDDSDWAKAEVKFAQPIIAAEEGYMYVYMSYENQSNEYVYFDDFTVTTTRSNVIQYNEYYPFGLQTSTSWTRESTKDNNYLYNAANELNKTSSWYEMYYREYDPAIGRMLQVDPYAMMYASTTTYNYALNNPVMMNDPSGGLVNAVGYTDSQLHTMYRHDRFSGGTSDFGAWASNNLDSFGMGDRKINGGNGIDYYGINENGQTGLDGL
jgi:RHS repeat-associated protein